MLRIGADTPLKINFVDGDVFYLSEIFKVDPSIYGKDGIWSAQVLEVLHSEKPEKKVIFTGTCIDFFESDIEKIQIKRKRGDLGS